VSRLLTDKHYLMLSSTPAARNASDSIGNQGSHIAFPVRVQYCPKLDLSQPQSQPLLAFDELLNLLAMVFPVFPTKVEHIKDFQR
jgi:hypothetical protein